MGRLNEKVVVVTGASSGIAKTTSAMISKEGGKLILVDKNNDEGEATLELVRQSGSEAIFVHADITDEVQVRELFDKTISHFGKVDIIFNSAGVWSPDKDGKIIHLEQDVWDLILDVNLRGTYLMCKYAIPHLIDSAKGSIINVASQAAIRAQKGSGAAYTASKGGVLSMSRLLAAELAKKNVRVNTISPGYISTPINKEALEKNKVTTPLGRNGIPEDIGHAVVYLASDESSFVTGTNIAIDGGLSAELANS